MQSRAIKTKSMGRWGKRGRILTAEYIIAVCLFLLSRLALAATIHIPADRPTIQAGIDAAVNGDTVLVAPGDYYENISYQHKNIAIISSDGPTVTFLRPQDSVLELIYMNAAYAQFSGFSVIGGPVINTIPVFNGVDMLISDNIFRDYAGGDVVIRSHSDVRIIRNLFYDNKGAACIRVDAHASATIINNTFYHNSGGFITSSVYGVAKNNIICSSTSCAISGQFEELDYNCLWNSCNYIRVNDSGAHSIIADPRFTAPEMQDFSLDQTSPCINAGDPAPEYNDPDGSRNDIGLYPFLGGYPRLCTLNLGDNELQHVLNSSPTIYWSYEDPDARQVAYEIEVGTDSDWTVAEKWSTGQVASSDTSVVYDGLELSDGENCFVRVRISNGIRWNDWSQLQFRMNTEPTPPVPQWPADGESVRTYVFEMSVVNASDAEGDSLSYEYEIYDDPSMSRLLRCRINVKEQPDSTLLKLVYNLEAGRDYWWRSRAFDGFEYSEWTPLSVFTLSGGAVLRVPSQWQTIQSAVDASVDGDKILVAPGTYSENVYNSSKNISIVGEEGAALTILQPENPTLSTLTAWGGTKSELRGFTLRGSKGPQAVYIFEPARLIISECRFTGNDGQDSSSAIIMIWGNAIIERNLFYVNKEAGCIRMWINNRETEILNNTFDRNDTGVNSKFNRGIVKNNIFTNFARYATYGDFPVCSYNCFWNNTGHRLIGDSLTLDPGPENMVADPRFIYRLDGDYRLLPESPCVDAGDPHRQYYDPDGSRSDIGALPFDLDYPLPVGFNFGPSAIRDILPTLTPEFYWSFVDMEPTSQEQYELEVGTDNNWQEGEMWATGPVQSADTHLVYAGQPLQDHHAYVARVRVSNGEKWGSWVTRSFAIQVEETSSDWSTDMGNVRRTGCNPNDKIQPPLERQWAIRVSPGPIWPATVVGDRLFITSHGSGLYVWCLDANDGHLLWRADYGPKDYFSQPSYGYGMVFIQVKDMPSFVSALDIETGTEVWRTSYPNQHFRSLAPAVYDGQVSICGDFYGGVHTFDAFSGDILWKRRLGDLNLCEDRWTPAQYGGDLYVFIADYVSWLHVLDKVSGEVLWSYRYEPKSALANDSTYLYMNTMAVIDTATELAFLPNIFCLQAIDINTHELVWQVGGGEIYHNTPAIYDRNVYIIRNGVLDVRDVKTGDSLWSFTCEEGFFSPIFPPEAGTDYSPLIANNYVFLSSCSTMYAVDINTHQAVWSDPVAGFPVVSHEKLYVSSPNGFLHMYSAAPTDVDSEDESIIPDQFTLNQNYPNPFNASTRIDYYLPKAGYVKLVIHNILGQIVRVLVDEFQPAGEKTVYWDGCDRDGVQVATGIYLYNLQAGDFLKTKKMLFLK